jgi:hypothetical protein
MACRICTINDHDASADELAQAMWASCIDNEAGSEWEPRERPDRIGKGCSGSMPLRS